MPTRLLVSLYAALVVTAALTGSANAATIVKLHHDLPQDSAQQMGAERFKKLVEERTDGQIKVRIFPNNALGNDVEVAQQIQFGAVKAGLIPTAKLSNFDSKLELVDLPFLFPTLAAAHKVLDGPVGDKVADGLRHSGFEPAGFWDVGFKELTCNHKVTKPSDLEGYKVRVMQSPLLIAQFKALGANPTPISFTETYTALQQGVVDCQENPIVSIAKMKFYEVQSDMMLSNHGFLGDILVFNKAWFDGLPAGQQQILKSSAHDARDYERKQTLERRQQYLNQIRDSGNTTIVKWSPAQKKAFRAALQPVYDQFKPRIGADLVNQAQLQVEGMNNGS
ncbi:MAG: TRAP transporter substrate-binding protein [Salinisphaera sp.]|jgi:tripartite ATP-independent transporter DctP family solute receptor|nr:TRAP transporter substrate-binding protein [Salinisphaera sp.]